MSNAQPTTQPTTLKRFRDERTIDGLKALMPFVMYRKIRSENSCSCMVTYAYPTLDERGILCVQEASHIVQVTKHDCLSVEETMDELMRLLECRKHDDIQKIIGEDIQKIIRRHQMFIKKTYDDEWMEIIATNVVFIRIVRLTTD